MKIQISTRGQFYVTIPGQLALAKGFKKGDAVNWELDRKGI